MTIPGVAVVAAGLVAGAVWLVLPDPLARLRRVRRTPIGVQKRRLIGRTQVVVGVAAVVAVWAAVGSMLGAVALPVALLAGAGAVWFHARLEPRQARVRRRAVTDDLPITLELMASCLDAGAPLRRAVAQVAQLCAPSTAVTLRGLDDAVRLGVHEPEAWGRLLDDPLWAPIATDMMRCADTGAAATEVLREHAADARRAAADARLAAARTVGVRSVLPLMVCFLPAFLLIGVVPIVASLLPKFLGH